LPNLLQWIADGLITNHPIAGELYSARRAGGAFLNGQPIKVSGATDLTRARICVGFSYPPAGRGTCARRRITPVGEL
jgi:myo-inositol-1(or 4)-monophosphatase